jgi:DNA polymerase beta
MLIPKNFCSFTAKHLYDMISNDIDVMIYHPDVKFVRQIFKPESYDLKSYLELFVDLLTKDGFLLDHLSVDKMKYMGFCKYKSYPVRRIDIRLMPHNSLSAAMLYFTGPAQLNEEMRLRAKKRNMLLNEYGLFLVDSHGNRISVPIHSEKDIFNELGMIYLTPKERQSYALKSKNIDL